MDVGAEKKMRCNQKAGSPALHRRVTTGPYDPRKRSRRLCLTSILGFPLRLALGYTFQTNDIDPTIGASSFEPIVINASQRVRPCLARHGPPRRRISLIAWNGLGSPDAVFFFAGG
jgi:hypothetical protein